nr:hotdog fold thioesterase [Bacteroidota bacterium]
MKNQNIDINAINNFCKGTLISHLNIKFDLENGELIATMPVSANHLQPMGILHGGASSALAETLGGAYSFMIVDKEKYNIVGANMQASHVGSISSGRVIARCVPVHIGTSTHVIDIVICDEQDRKISVCRLTNMIIEK